MFKPLNKLKIIFILFSIFYFLFSISTPMAQAQGLVPCGPGVAGNETCDFCDLLKLVEIIIDFSLYKIAIPLVVVFVIYGGFMIMTAGSSSERVSQGKKIIQAAVIGILIALLAWLLIDTILKVVATGDGMPNQWWNPGAKLKC